MQFLIIQRGGIAMSNESLPEDHQFSEEFERKMKDLIEHGLSSRNYEDDDLIDVSLKGDDFLADLQRKEDYLDEALKKELLELEELKTKKRQTQFLANLSHKDIEGLIDSLPPIMVFGENYKRKILLLYIKLSAIAFGFILLLLYLFFTHFAPVNTAYWSVNLLNWFQNI
ncbi:MAG: hypothetical protein R3Y47_11375 [Lachnospiraceae bacterium]